MRIRTAANISLRAIANKEYFYVGEKYEAS